MWIPKIAQLGKGTATCRLNSHNLGELSVVVFLLPEVSHSKIRGRRRRKVQRPCFPSSSSLRKSDFPSGRRADSHTPEVRLVHYVRPAPLFRVGPTTLISDWFAPHAPGKTQPGRRW